MEIKPKIDIDVHDIIKKVQALGATEAEVYLCNIKRLSIEAIKDKIEEAAYTHTLGLGLRVAVGKRVACLGTSISRLKDIENVLKRAVKIARASPEDKSWVSLPRKLDKSDVYGVYDSKAEKISVNRVIGIVMDNIDKLKTFDKRVTPVGASLTISIIEHTIGNSHSETVRRIETSITYAVGAKAQEDGKEGVYHETVYSKRLDIREYEKATLKSAKRALENLNAKPIETCKTDVILEGKVLAAILSSALAPAITADNVQQKRSPLRGKLNSQILSEQLTLIDDPTRPWLYGTKEFDDEGVATRRNTIISNGVLRSYIYDTYTALKEGRDSTGNAYRPSLSSMPKPWIHNLLVQGKNEVKLEDMIRDTKHGLVISSTIGYWLSNPVSGYVNATVVHGYLVKEGEIVDYVKGVIISDNIYNMLKEKIEAIGKSEEREYYLNVYAPPIKIKEVTIAGK